MKIQIIFLLSKFPRNKSAEIFNSIYIPPHPYYNFLVSINVHFLFRKITSKLKKLISVLIFPVIVQYNSCFLRHIIVICFVLKWLHDFGESPIRKSNDLSGKILEKLRILAESHAFLN